jgi:hypothetical protein
MVRVANYETFFLERCSLCAFEHRITKSLKHHKIRRNDAQGIRDQNMTDHWRDALQPLDMEGRENKLFTKTYGYNPSAENPNTPKNIPSLTGIGSGNMPVQK